MSRRNYGLYGLAIAGGAGVAVWAGLPIYLLFLLACPLMMVFMMSGMHGGQDSHDGSSGRSGRDDARATDGAGRAGERAVGPSDRDASPERLDPL